VPVKIVFGLLAHLSQGRALTNDHVCGVGEGALVKQSQFLPKDMQKRGHPWLVNPFSDFTLYVFSYSAWHEGIAKVGDCKSAIKFILIGNASEQDGINISGLDKERTSRGISPAGKSDVAQLHDQDFLTPWSLPKM